MKRIASTLAAALGYTFLTGIWILASLLGPKHRTFYHWPSTAAALCLPLLADFVLLWLAFAIVFLSSTRPGVWRRTVWLALLLFLPWIFCNTTLALYSLLSPPFWLKHLLLGAAALAFVLLELTWRPAWDEPFARIIGFATTCLTFVSFTAFLVMGRVGFGMMQARDLNATTAFAHTLPVSTAVADRPGRVVWVVFDELSDAQVFDHRFPGLKMPEFDALAAQSTRLSNVIPAGDRTEAVLPALMTGKPVQEIASTFEGQLRLRLRGASHGEDFDQADTVFADARKLGFHTAVAGWYNPYCRLLPAVLDRCSWTDDLLTPAGVGESQSFAKNMLAMARASDVMPHMFDRQSSSHMEAAAHIHDLRRLQAASALLLRDPALGFVFIHLPAPHPRGIYDRTHARLRDDDSGSYIDNLALADALLGQLRQVLESTGQWDSTTLIVMGDHGWRWPYWQTVPGWQPEDKQARGDAHADLRPAYLIKLPAQQQPAMLHQPFSAVNTRALFDALLQRTICTPQDLDRFVSNHSATP